MCRYSGNQTIKWQCRANTINTADRHATLCYRRAKAQNAKKNSRHPCNHGIELASKPNITYFLLNVLPLTHYSALN